MENNLKNRYIFAVIRHLPVRIQSDVREELESLISEMIEERKGNDASPSEQDIKNVLAELGTPEEMALKYYGSERTSLISGVYFLMYKLILATVLPIVAVVLTVLAIAGFIMGAVVGEEFAFQIPVFFGSPNLGFAVQAIIGIVGAVIQTFAIITVVFAVLDYMKVDIKEIDFLELPEVPVAKMKISPLDAIFGISLSISITALFLVFPQVMTLRIESVWIPVFDIAVLRSLWLPFVLWMILEIGTEIVKVVEGRYTMRLAAIVVVAAVFQVIFAITIFGNNDIMNPDFISFIRSLDDGGFRVIGLSFDNLTMRPNLIAMIIILIVLFFETLDVVVKAFRSR